MTGDAGWRYPPEFLEALSAAGLAPTCRTPPGFVRDALSALYRFELRRLRDRLRAGETPKETYLDLVVQLRKKYWLLTLTTGAWTKICRDP